jgi:hypothetical protein
VRCHVYAANLKSATTQSRRISHFALLVPLLTTHCSLLPNLLSKLVNGLLIIKKVGGKDLFRRINDAHGSHSERDRRVRGLAGLHEEAAGVASAGLEAHKSGGCDR